MFHGVKKSEIRKPTPEEAKKNEERLAKIKVIHGEILRIKGQLEYSQKTIDFLLKASMLMPDFPTIWSVRKILIEKHIATLKDEEILAYFAKEIKSITPIMVKNPKCYFLWYHRIWSLEKCVQIEIKNGTPLEKSLLVNEIRLTDKFFETDDRNFHCWNYRVNLLSLISIYYTQTFQEFIKKELKFTLEKVTKNFSNFSAWHYRTKLIPIYFVQNEIQWGTEKALEFFKDDLELIKKAIYTDPKDQSPWNYFEWIINNFMPIFVKNITVNKEKGEVNIEYSNVFKMKNLIEIKQENNNNDNECAYQIIEEQNAKSEFSNVLKLQIDKEKLKNGSILICNKTLSQNDIGFDRLNLVTNKICFTKENLELPLIRVGLDNDEICYTVTMNNLKEFQIVFLNKCLSDIQELVTVSVDTHFMEYAQVRLYHLLKYFYDTKRYESKNEEKEEFRKKIIEKLDLLQKNSKRLYNLYKTLYEEMSHQI